MVTGGVEEVERGGAVGDCSSRRTNDKMIEDRNSDGGVANSASQPPVRAPQILPIKNPASICRFLEVSLSDRQPRNSFETFTEHHISLRNLGRRGGAPHNRIC